MRNRAITDKLHIQEWEMKFFEQSVSEKKECKISKQINKSIEGNPNISTQQIKDSDLPSLFPTFPSTIDANLIDEQQSPKQKKKKKRRPRLK